MKKLLFGALLSVSVVSGLVAMETENKSTETENRYKAMGNTGLVRVAGVKRIVRELCGDDLICISNEYLERIGGNLIAKETCDQFGRDLHDTTNAHLMDDCYELVSRAEKIKQENQNS